MSIPFDVDEIMDSLYDSVADDMRELGVDLVTALVLTSPVGDPTLWQSEPPPDYRPGHLVKNWNVTIGFESDDELPGEDPVGAQTIEDARRELAFYDGIDVENFNEINIQNAVPYIVPISQGWSQQAPAGFIERTVQVVAAENPGEIEI